MHLCISGRYEIIVCDILIHEEYNTSGKVHFYRIASHMDLPVSIASVQLYFLLFTRNVFTTRKDSTTRIFVMAAYTYYKACEYVVIAVYP